MDLMTELQRRAKQLEALGIPSLGKEQMQALTASLSSLEPEMLEGMNLTAMLLTQAGRGSYDFEAGEWTPTSRTVYAFDVECFDVERMYTLFFEGVNAIAGPVFTQVVEDNSLVNWDEGSGVKDLSFLCHGHPSQHGVLVEHDWFDLGVVGCVNRALEQESDPNRLCMMGDGYQECILFWNTPEWAERFSRETGCRLACPQ